MSHATDTPRGRRRRWLRRRNVENVPASRTWFRKQSDGTYFRNCPLIMAERERALDARDLRAVARLAEEWAECFREGVITADEIGPGDEWIEHDDSREAIERWVEQILTARVEQQMRDGKTT